MNDQPAAKSLRLAGSVSSASSATTGETDHNSHQLNVLADLEVDMQNASHCIRLRGDDACDPQECPLRRAA